MSMVKTAHKKVITDLMAEPENRPPPPPGLTRNTDPPNFLFAVQIQIVTRGVISWHSTVCADDYDQFRRERGVLVLASVKLGA